MALRLVVSDYFYPGEVSASANRHNMWLYVVNKINEMREEKKNSATKFTRAMHAMGNDLVIPDYVIMHMARFLFYDSNTPKFQLVLQKKIYRMLFFEILRCSVGFISRSDDDFEDTVWVVNMEILHTGEVHKMAAENCHTCGNYYHYKSYQGNVARYNLFCHCV